MSQSSFREMVDAYKGLDRRDKRMANIMLGTLTAGALIALVPPVRKPLAPVVQLLGDVIPGASVVHYDDPSFLGELYQGATIQDMPEVPAGPLPTELPPLPDFKVE